MRLIDAYALVKTFENMGLGEHGLIERVFADGVFAVIENVPTIDAVPVVRCKDCVYFRDRHIHLPDGTERDYVDGEDFVTADVGVNVGSQCRKEEEPCFREGGDFCSRGVRKEGENDV